MQAEHHRAGGPCSVVDGSDNTACMLSKRARQRQAAAVAAAAAAAQQRYCTQDAKRRQPAANLQCSTH